MTSCVHCEEPIRYLDSAPRCVECDAPVCSIYERTCAWDHFDSKHQQAEVAAAATANEPGGL